MTLLEPPPTVDAPLAEDPTRSNKVAPPPAPPAPPPTAPRAVPRRRRLRLLVAVAATALVVGTGGGYLGAELAGRTPKSTTVLSSPTVSGTDAAAQTVAQVAAAVSPSVVAVTAVAGQSTSEGSGIILSSDGLILTNAHVVSETSASSVQGGDVGTGITVTFADGRATTASIVGTDTTYDIAVLKASGVSGLTPATLGSSSTVNVGDTVVAIGSPLGLEGTVTSGIVSALNRTVEIGDSSSPFGAQTATLTNAVQTDAPINPGNSGGPLIDTSGRVIGLTAAMASINGDSGSIGIGFAIPIDTARSIVETLLAHASTTG